MVFPVTTLFQWVIMGACAVCIIRPALLLTQAGALILRNTEPGYFISPLGVFFQYMSLWVKRETRSDPFHVLVSLLSLIVPARSLNLASQHLDISYELYIFYVLIFPVEHYYTVCRHLSALIQHEYNYLLQRKENSNINVSVWFASQLSLKLIPQSEPQPKTSITAGRLKLEKK